LLTAFQQDNVGRPSNSKETNESKDKEGEESEQPAEQQTLSDDKNASWEQGQDDQQQQQQQQQGSEHDQNARATANPYRNLGDATKEWKRRLNVVQDQKPKSEQDEKRSDKPQKQNEEASAFEFLEENEPQQEDDLQAMGAATENQAKEAALQDQEEV